MNLDWGMNGPGRRGGGRCDMWEWDSGQWSVVSGQWDAGRAQGIFSFARQGPHDVHPG